MTPAHALSWLDHMIIKGGRVLSTQERTAYSVVSAVSYAASIMLGWLSNFDAGAFATSFTVISLAGIAAYSQWVKARAKEVSEKTRLEADRIREVERAKAEAWAERMRLETQVRIDQEKLEAGSLNGQIKALQAAIEESNRTAAESKQRVEAANKKLHDMASERQAELFKHTEETQQLMLRLERVTQDLEATRHENRRLMAKLGSQVQANTGALGRLAPPLELGHDDV